MDFSKNNFPIEKPNTPHNTTQYLTSNFTNEKQSEISHNLDFNSLNKSIFYEENKLSSEIINKKDNLNELKEIYNDFGIMEEDSQIDFKNLADEFCVPGGSMKCKIFF